MKAVGSRNRSIAARISVGIGSMTAEPRSLAEVTQEAVRLLYKEIGIVNTVRFLSQFTTGYGNYTKEREELFADKTLDDLIDEVRRSKTH
jgi:hypothetical protein